MQFRKTVLAVSVLAALSGCGLEGKDGSNGANGVNSHNTLVKHSQLSVGHEMCFQGGTEIASGLDSNTNGVLGSDEIENATYLCSPTVVNQTKNFNRIATYPVCQQIDAACHTDLETAAEIVAASKDGNTLVYTDSPQGQIGFVDISQANAPVGLGVLALSGEPTSVAIKDGYALVGVNTSTDFINVSGELAVVDIATRTLVSNIALAGQPDSVAVSPDGMYAAVVIENERDEDLGDGTPPQAPAGLLQIVALSGDVNTWSATNIDLSGIADLYSGDPEPEYVDINSDNIAVVSLQENNHIALVDLTTGDLVNDFSAGTVDLTQVDASEAKPALISQTESLSSVPREPDGVSWINNEYFVTADEGDLDGGSRGFTVFNTAGEVVYGSGNELDHLTARLGHYPDGRSENKGNEPENAELGVYGDDRYLFVNSERSSLIFVYDAADPTKPVYKQSLPAASAPEGALAIPSRNLLVVASENDARADKLRASLNIYQYNTLAASYPTLESVNRFDGTPISWSAMSGLSSDPMNENVLYAVEDSFYQSNRIFTLDVSQTPAKIIAETRISDANDIFANFSAASIADTSVATDDPTRIEVFDEVDLAAMINADKTINIDPEGIAKASDGGFWVASEGNGTLGDSARPINSLNFIFKTDSNGVIEDVITLPTVVNNAQLRFGFEGVTEHNGNVYVAFQRVWAGDTDVRIGIYDTTAQSWSFLFYPLDAVESQNGGWVGLSDITSLGNGEFLVLERDNQGGPDAAIKRLYTIDVTGLAADSLVTKTLVRDLMEDLAAPGGLIYEKIEGSAVMKNGDVYIINDNDGVDDNSGETQLINLGNILP